MNPGDLHVLVVGGAVGGSAAALLLARAGARVTLVERVAQPRAIGAGIALAENGLAVLESLGLGPGLAAGRPIDGARITDARGRSLFVPPASGPRVVMVRRSTLHGVLLDAVVAEARIDRHFGVELVRAERDGTAVVRPAGEGRDGGDERVLRADLVIGADGLHSRVRDCGAFGAHVRGTGIRYVRSLVAEGLGEGVEAWTAAGVFGSFAVDGATYVFASCGTRECRDALDARDLDAFRDAWAVAYPPARLILAGLRDFDELLVNEVVRVDCARWSDGRLALLGDAAHAMAPNLGQGANSALVDAAVLLDELRRAPAVEPALAAYEARRRRAVAMVATASARAGRVAELTHPALRAVRDRLLLPVLQRLASPRAAGRVMQESSDVLLAIGRA